MSREYCKVYGSWENKPRKRNRKLIFMSLIVGILLLLVLGNLNYNQRIIGRVTQDIEINSHYYMH